ncbi:MAG TPA: DUF418 domain-containing protein [Burkholderiaceae bacterium]|nr:DUF418 domain-containing protein [Burkholderiaceae bacterium]
MRREALIDALRAYALLGVFVVNALCYVYAFEGSTLGRALPPDSQAALWVHIVTGSLFQAKSYPLLAFLVGYSLAMTLRGAQRSGVSLASALEQRHQRTSRQLALGVVHGTFLYYGDILTNYALLSFVLLRLARRRVMTIVRFTAGLAIVLVALLALQFTSHQNIGYVSSNGAITQVSTLNEWWRLNAAAYFAQLTGVVFLVPWLLLPASLGLIAGRLRWLERPRRWAAQWRRVARVALPIGALASIAHGVSASLASARSGGFAMTNAEPFLVVIGMVFDAGLLGLAALAYHEGRGRGIAAWLAPAGRMSLSLYIAASMTMLLLFAGPTLNLAPRLGSIGLFGFGVGFWVLSILIARAWQRGGRRGPFEAWMAR